MPPKKHEVDPQNQGMLLASPTALAVGAVVELEKGYYRAPERASETPGVAGLSPEQEETVSRLEAESKALDALSSENKSLHGIITTDRQIHKIRESGQHERLLALNEKAAGSIAARERLRALSKFHLARSLGLEAEMDSIERPYPSTDEYSNRLGPDIKLQVTRTKKPDQQDYLDSQYRQFRAQYYGDGKARRLKGRKDGIEKEVSEAAVTDST